MTTKETSSMKTEPTNEVNMTNETEPTNDTNKTIEVPVEYLFALRRAAGLHVNPETAEVKWIYAQTPDPYGDDPNLPEEWQQVGREYFARSPESDVWICFCDLPKATRDALWDKHKSKLAFPAGLPWREGR